LDYICHLKLIYKCKSGLKAPRPCADPTWKYSWKASNIVTLRFALQMPVGCSTFSKVINQITLSIRTLFDSLIIGTFAETTSPEHQLHWIFENCKIVRSANGLSTIVEAMKIASSKHDLLWYPCSSLSTLSYQQVVVHSYSSLSDADAARFHISATEKADFVEEVTTEISVYLGMLYHLIEVFKGHDEFADELSEWDSFRALFFLFLTRT
jgi:hypothetical protein